MMSAKASTGRDRNREQKCGKIFRGPLQEPLQCGYQESTLSSKESESCWSGGTGRRTGLKIPRPSLGMWVRPPPPAPKYLVLISISSHPAYLHVHDFVLRS